MATLVPQESNTDGVEISFTAAEAGGDDFDNSPKSGKRSIVALFKNDGGAPVDVTPVISKLVDGQSVVSKVISVTNGTIKQIGPFNKEDYGTTVNFTYSDVTGLSVALIQ